MMYMMVFLYGLISYAILFSMMELLVLIRVDSYALFDVLPGDLCDILRSDEVVSLMEQYGSVYGDMGIIAITPL